MIQRIQSLWLILAATAALLTLKLPVFSGNKMRGSDAAKQWVELTAVSHLLILLFTVAIAVGALMVIFLYKNRKLQQRFTLLGLLLSLSVLILYYNESRSFAEGNFNLTALIALAIPVFLVLALRGIYQDEKLIKDANRLR